MGTIKDTKALEGKSFKSGFVALECLRVTLDAHDELLGLLIESSRDMDANPGDIFKGGVFTGACRAVALLAGVSEELVQEIACEFAEVEI